MFSKELDSSRNANDVQQSDNVTVEKDWGQPNLASLGLVNTSSRIGVFTDNNLFGDEKNTTGDEHAHPEEYLDGEDPGGKVHGAAPGSLGLAEAISALANDIERLAGQESAVELTNNLAELCILGKSKSCYRSAT